MTTAYLIRTCFPTHTRGVFVALDTAGNLLAQCVTLELPWRDNQPQVSCIPEGIYPVRARKSEKHGDHYQVHDVPGRDLILLHPGNFVSQLRGCLLPGDSLADLNKDGIPDITNTRATLNKLLASLGAEFTLNIFTAPVPGGTLPEVTITLSS